MACLGRAGQALLQIQKAPRWSAFVVSARSKVFVNRDWQPGPYPETEAERRAAAKKYNMVYEDYKPYDKDAMSMTEFPLGDYPKLEIFGEYSRDPQANYEIHAWKRNYGEPMHPLYDAYIGPRYDVSARPAYPFWVQGCSLVGLVVAVFGAFWVCEYYDIRFQMVEVPVKKQYPADGVVHYTFEPAD